MTGLKEAQVGGPSQGRIHTLPLAPPPPQQSGHIYDPNLRPSPAPTSSPLRARGPCAPAGVGGTQGIEGCPPSPTIPSQGHSDPTDAEGLHVAAQTGAPPGARAVHSGLALRGAAETGPRPLLPVSPAPLGPTWRQAWAEGGPGLSRLIPAPGRQGSPATLPPRQSPALAPPSWSLSPAAGGGGRPQPPALDAVRLKLGVSGGSGRGGGQVGGACADRFRDAPQGLLT